MRKLLPLVALLLLSGCAAERESAKALLQADQAANGTQVQMTAIWAAIPPETQKVIKDKWDSMTLLVGQIRDSIAPAARYLSGGQALQVDTTTEEAVLNTPQFVKKATKQAVRAQVEVDAVGYWLQLGSGLLNTVMEGGWLNGMTMLLTGGGGVGLMLAGWAKTYLTTKLQAKALKDKAEEADDLADAPDDAAVVKVRAKHAHKQAVNGTAGVIAKVAGPVPAQVLTDQKPKPSS